MSEATQEGRPTTIEAEIKKESYPFIEALRQDYPDIAVTVESRLPAWKTGVDSTAEIPGFADLLLNGTKYTTKEEEQKFCNNIATEIQTALETNPSLKIVFIRYGGKNRSELYLQSHILNTLPKEYHSRILIPQSQDEVLEVLTANPNVQCYYIDDSSNSAQQMRGALQSVLSYVATDDISEIKIKAHLLGMSEDSKRKIGLVLNNVFKCQEADETKGNPVRQSWKSSNASIQVDINAPTTPNAYQVIKSLFAAGIIDEEKKQDLIDLTFAHHGRNSGTLALFYHRLLQDNVPGLFTEGNLTPSLKSLRIEPLFAGFEETNAY